MKNTSKSLNDLFRRAGDEAGSNADETVLSQSEVERLLRNSNVHSVPVTTGARIYRALFSTPLKTGMTAMTTTALVALGIFAFLPQNTVRNSQPTNNPPIYHTYSLASAGPIPGNLIVSAPKPMLVTHPTPSSPPPQRTVPTESIAIVDSLHPIDATPDQLAKLGIVLEDNGDIDFYTKDGDEINKFGMPPTWGVKMNLNEKHSDKDIEGISILKFSPKLITEPDGSKRLFSFESDTTITQINGNQVMMMRLENQMRVTPQADGAAHASNEPVSIQMYNARKNHDVKIEVSSDTNRPQTVDYNSRVRVLVNDSEMTPELEKQMRSVNMDSIMSSINLDSIVSRVNVDSILQSVKSQLQDQNVDSTLRAAHIALQKAKKFISSMKIHLDTGSINSQAAVRLELNANDTDDGSPNDADVKESIKIRLNSDSALDEEIPVPPNPPIVEMEQMANSLDMGKLIPVRVVNNKNPEHPNELIFWYDPTPDIQAAIPNHTEVSAEMATKHVTVSVYPNPTPGPAAVHFDLAGANSASYTIRNLLGQEVMSGGTLSGSTGDVKLDLSKLDAGVYLLVTETNSGEPDVQRIVVAK